MLWSIASLLSAFAGSYSTLLVTRLILGAVIATAGPAIASLTGDYFPASERGRIYAYILGGEIAGTAVGLHRLRHGRERDRLARRLRAARDPGLLPGAGAVPHGARAAARRSEPPRAGVADLVQAAAEARANAHADWLGHGPEDAREPDDLARAGGASGWVRGPTRRWSSTRTRAAQLVDSVRYILSIPTNVLMIISSSLGYFFFSGLSTFALLFVRGHYHVGQADVRAGAGAAGRRGAGRHAGQRPAHRRAGPARAPEARVWVPALCYLGAAALLIPGSWPTT